MLKLYRRQQDRVKVGLIASVSGKQNVDNGLWVIMMRYVTFHPNSLNVSRDLFSEYKTVIEIEEYSVYPDDKDRPVWDSENYGPVRKVLSRIYFMSDIEDIEFNGGIDFPDRTFYEEVIIKAKDFKIEEIGG